MWNDHVVHVCIIFKKNNTGMYPGYPGMFGWCIMWNNEVLWSQLPNARALQDEQGLNILLNIHYTYYQRMHWRWDGKHQITWAHSDPLPPSSKKWRLEWRNQTLCFATLNRWKKLFPFLLTRVSDHLFHSVGFTENPTEWNLLRQILCNWIEKKYWQWESSPWLQCVCVVR